MCVIYVGHSDDLKREDLTAFQRYSPDGTGVIGLESGRFARWEDNRRVWNSVRTMREPIVLHCRFATSGTLSKANLHPFRLEGGGYLAHNGHMTGLGDNLRSDTREFAEDIWPIHRGEWLTNPALNKVLGAIFGNDRVVIALVPDAAGVWTFGKWDKYAADSDAVVSNTYWRAAPRPKGTGGEWLMGKGTKTTTTTTTTVEARSTFDYDIAPCDKYAHGCLCPECMTYDSTNEIDYGEDDNWLAYMANRAAQAE